MVLRRKKGQLEYLERQHREARFRFVLISELKNSTNESGQVFRDKQNHRKVLIIAFTIEDSIHELKR